MTDLVANIKILRDRTGVGLMECKKALAENDNDVDKAIEALRKAGQAKAVKKANRIAAEGLVAIAHSDDELAMVEINSETDFVARHEDFQAFVDLSLQAVRIAKSGDLELIKKVSIHGQELEQHRSTLVSKIGENIILRRAFYANQDNLASYSHGGRIGAVVQYSKGDASVARDIAMHIASENPSFTKESDMPASLLAKEMEIIKANLEKEIPSEAIREKAIASAMKKFIKQNNLLDQAFIKDPSTTVGKLLQDHDMQLLSFNRFEVGQGIEKKEENFAAEVMAQIK